MTRVGALVALVLLAGCGAPPRRTPQPEAIPVFTAATVFGGPSNVAQVRAANSVAALRLLGSEGARHRLGEELVRGWPAPQTLGEPPRVGSNSGEDVFGPVTTLAPEDAQALRSVLTSDETYRFDGYKGCLFVPGVLVRFWIEDAAIDVLICFQCVELVAFRDGQRLGHVTPFGPGSRTLLDAVRRVFPDDEALRALAERRE